MTSEPQIRPLGAQISHMLRARGVDTIFGIPGVHNQELYRGIEDAGITHVLARHEQGAAFMADGYARATGHFGVCYLITGPGVLNALTPLGQAYSDGVSVLAIASCLDNTVGQIGQLHQMKDQEAAADAVCDWSLTARDAQTAYGLVARALREFWFGGDRRPKAIHVPIEVLKAPAPPAPQSPVGEGAMLPDPMNVMYAAQRLKTAKRPLVMLGGGAKDLALHWGDRDGLPITELMARLNCASFCTFAGRGLIAPDAPLHFGPFLTRPGSADVIAQADVVLAIGTQLGEVDIWRDALGHRGDAMIRVDTSTETLNAQKGWAFNIQADARSFVRALLDRLPEPLPPSEWSPNDVAAAKVRWRGEVDAEFPGVLPVMDALRAAMPDDAMIYSDMTQFAYAAKECWDMTRPGHWHHPSGFGTLGFSLPAAIGGAVARPGLPTVCIIGDYGVQYTLPELGTAVELGLPLPIILWDNGKLGAIEDSMIAAQIAPNSVVQRNPDFLALAKAYGAKAAQPASLDDIGPALKAAFAADVPTVIRLTPDLAS